MKKTRVGRPNICSRAAAMFLKANKTERAGKSRRGGRARKARSKSGLENLEEL